MPTGQEIADYAKSFIGSGYSTNDWHGCSGFTAFVYSHFGYKVSGNTTAQRAQGKSVYNRWTGKGSLDDVRVGDLIIYEKASVGQGDPSNDGLGHAAIYVGGGNIVGAQNDSDGVKKVGWKVAGGDKNINYIRRFAGKVGGSPASPSDSSGVGGQYQKGGDFQFVKNVLSVKDMRKARFNPPTAHAMSRFRALPKNFHSNFASLAQMKENKPGWIVRDPLAFGMNDSATATSDVGDYVGGANDKAEEFKTRDSATGKWLGTTKFYGFRFHYNPEQADEGYQTMIDGDPLILRKGISEGTASLVGNTGGQLHFTARLNRRLDRHIINTGGKDALDLWVPSLTEVEAKGISERGTLYDLEYLFRVTNGDPQDTWHGISSDWGMIMPMLVIVSLGDPTEGKTRRLRGMLTNVSVRHLLFDPGMIPVQTDVTFTLDRMADGYYMSDDSADADQTKRKSDKRKQDRVDERRRKQRKRRKRNDELDKKRKKQEEKDRRDNAPKDTVGDVLGPNPIDGIPGTNPWWK